MFSLEKMKSEFVDNLHQQSITRGIAKYRLDHEALDPQTRSNLEEVLEIVDYMLLRLMAGLTVLLAEPCPLRHLFIEDADVRVMLIEEIVAAAQKRAQPGGGGISGALVAQVERLRDSAYKN